jgi:nucleoside-diphosphate-sugar epimerase
MTEQVKRLFCFGLGYSARKLAISLMKEGWSVEGTCRSESKQAELFKIGIDAKIFDGSKPIDDAGVSLARASHVLSSVPPSREGDEAGKSDSVFDLHSKFFRTTQRLQWVGYLSTTGVYGDAGGRSVDEFSPINPSSERSQNRVAAEASWLSMGAHIFRLAGIYGPGRNVLDKARDGSARRVEKPGHKFSRIYVDDITTTVRASIDRPNPGAIYNVCDDEAASPAEVSRFAYEILGLEPPLVIPFKEAAKTMSPMGLSFWQDNRLVDNSRIKEELGVNLACPNYRVGLRAILAAEN